MRLFVALAVPGEVVSAVDDATRPLRERHPELNWTPPASWHVTLAFLGEVDGQAVDEVVAALREAVTVADVGPLELRLAGAGRFGQRTAWLRVVDRPAEAVAALGAEVQRAVAGVGLPVDAKEVRPHVTLVRARGRKGRLPAGLVDELPDVEASWRADAVVLYRSHLGRGPVEYEALAEVDLRAPAG